MSAETATQEPPPKILTPEAEEIQTRLHKLIEANNSTKTRFKFAIVCAGLHDRPLERLAERMFTTDHEKGVHAYSFGRICEVTIYDPCLAPEWLKEMQMSAISASSTVELIIRDDKEVIPKVWREVLVYPSRLVVEFDMLAAARRHRAAIEFATDSNELPSPEAIDTMKRLKRKKV